MAGRPRKIASEYARYSTPEAILLAAEAVVSRRGPGHLKMNEIASEVGIESASVYNHFKGLDGVLSELISRSLKEQIALLDTMPDGLDAEAATVELCRRSVRFFATRPGIARLTISDFAEVHEKNPNAFDVNQKTIVELIDREADILRRNPGFSDLDRRRLGEISISRQAMTLMLLGISWINERETDEARIAEIATMVSDMILAYASKLEA